jgi:uncharacterized protein (TIGR03437 family)
MTLRLIALGAIALAALAEGPGLHVDAAANRHPISPDIYGINFNWDASDPLAGADIRATARRWGGNSTSTYHWKFDVSNHDADWFYEVLPDTGIDASKLPDNSSFNQMFEQVRQTRGKMLATIPILGWLPKARQEMCSYDVAKYGKQCRQDPYAQYHPYTCGDGIAYLTACGDPSANDGYSPPNPSYITNDPHDAYAQFDEHLQEDWIRYTVVRYGEGNRGGVAIWSLDNEPIWWDTMHRDIHPQPYTYDELLAVDLKYAQAIKSADPSALVSGPVADNWASLWMSKADIVSGWTTPDWWSKPVDRNAHGGVPLMPWYLQRMRDYEQRNGVRLLDYLDLHAYLAPNATSSAGAINPLVDSTREFWDPNYVVTGDYWIVDTENNGAPVAPRLIPRLREIVAQNYPGTKIAITEYNWGALDTLNGALAQAEILGVFGRESLDLATLWGPPKPSDPSAFAFKIYRNYDGIGGTFGDTSVSASSDDPGRLSVFAAQRSDQALTLMIINKTGAAINDAVAIANFTAAAVAQVWRYSSANLGAIARGSDAAVNGGNVSVAFPANSVTLLVVPVADSGTKPKVTAVVNAASYTSQIAPGTIVAVFGTGLGPASLASGTVSPALMVGTDAGGARVLFDGVPAPVLWARQDVIAAVVPYFTSLQPSTRVQVEYQGRRSDPLEAPVSATAPGLFTSNAQGSGNAAVLNQDSTVNSPANPAATGSVIALYATGEGISDIPGVDGRVATSILPKPQATVALVIGGKPATDIRYAGAAPDGVAGAMQINVAIPQGVGPGAVPVKLSVGGQNSADGVTISLK